MRGADGAEAVDGLAEGIDHAAEHGVPDRDVHDAAGGAALVTLLDVLDVAEEDRADLVAVEVLGEAVDVTPGERARELEKLSGHGALEARHVSDAVADLRHDGGLLLVDRGVDGRELLAERVHDLLRADGVRHFSSPPMNEEESVFLMFASWARTEAS